MILCYTLEPSINVIRATYGSRCRDLQPNIRQTLKNPVEEEKEGLKEPSGVKDTTRKPTESTTLDLQRLTETDPP